MGLGHFSSEADRQRQEVARTLRRLAWVAGLMVVALSVTAVVLARLYRRSDRASQANQRTTERLGTIVRSSVDGILVLDRDGSTLEFSPAAESIFGYRRDEMLGRNAGEVLLPPDVQEAVVDEIEQLITTEDGAFSGSHRLEVEGVCKNGSRLPIEVTIAGSKSAEGDLAVAFLRDISRRRATERELLDARDKALAGERAKAEFLAVMSHEMRTPLNGLLGSAELLATTRLEPKQREILDIIETSGKILLQHVNSVLDISSAEAGAMRFARISFSIDALVQEVVANQAGLAAAMGNQIEVISVTGPVGRLQGDPARLRQILLNLVGNAVKFTTNGRITVEIEALTSPGPRGMRAIEFRVIDTGIGIPEADQARIFDDFVTLDRSYGRAAEGSGLGLAITRRLVLAMGGEIGVESEPEGGSLFWVRLPFRTETTETEPALPPEGKAGPAETSPQVASVLLIEDNPINRFVLRSLLDEMAVDVREASDGVEGVALAEARRFDLIFMDISMPHMDGIEAARRIRLGTGASRAARIVAVTAHALPEEVARFRAAGMEDCLVKPVSRGALNRLLRGEAADPPGPGSPAKEDLVDPASLSDLAGHLQSATFIGLLRRFLAEGDAALGLLVGEGSGDVTTKVAMQMCHRLAGSAATFGARGLAAALMALENALASDTDATVLRAAILEIWAETRAAMEAAYPALTTPSVAEVAEAAARNA
jgi:PAS domain S-box-containing protein